MEFDWRILIVLSPVLLAGGWAAYNVGTIALKQVEKLLNKET
ncbi:MAG: photosystem II protein Y [Microcoleus sp. PH2017_10_PVI_O_A]|nr:MULTISPECIES: photosystem II protein Y [unclassified Microcoleus]TAE81316.1 MAG: photosystem II protein Y [Oscillatoriales cyanobacterium]MCC3405407.1 photosystem II protein Y [Microcoleus sp. PH2017_10_PVI_O_A]MCC3459400.1 photosystem II protein Y [Microcoleus sp. PH2017_11_PCY_U_A]MCC3477680.1 photosystem II protein Y [Microcoleus sp. PH2017_12_PCY_D_A]MCC3527402.1 photosystem II protein Y [Microcoleus sp. PH2017_21_RUC_O_A]